MTMEDSPLPAAAAAVATSALAAAAPKTTATTERASNTATTTTTTTTTLSYSSADAATAGSNIPRGQQQQQQQQQPPPFVFTAANSSGGSDPHAHRLNHNPSKLPAFRFADRRKETLVLPTVLAQTSGIPPTPVSPSTDPSQDQALPVPKTPAAPKTPARATGIPPKPSPESPPRTYHNTAPPQSPFRGASWSRAATFHSPARTSAPATQVRPTRTISLDVSRRASQLADVSSADDSTITIKTIGDARTRQRTAPSYSIDNSKRKQRLSESSQDSVPVEEDITKEWATRQRELLLPRTATTTSIAQRLDSNERRSLLARRPPVSYKTQAAADSRIPSAGNTSRIPPIRTFRSSGDRTTLGIDMNIRSPTRYDDDDDDDYDVADDRDLTLRALEGRRESEAYETTPLDSALRRHDADDSGDVFLRMARDEPESAVSRILRSANRRPLSSVIPSYSTMSPPRAVRRLSDQESPRTRFADMPAGERMARALNYRSLSREQAGDEQKSRFNSGKSPRMTPRSLTFQEPSADPVGPSHSRRQSITEGSKSPQAPRLSSLKTSGLPGPGRGYNSSPLVPKSAEVPKQEQPQGDTESSASTAAPSTVWDELDDLKSRIRRLELTGKLPATSGAAVSRASEEPQRPPTATTNATTMSASPKRGTGAAAQGDAATTVSTVQKESAATQPLLQSAIMKSQPLLPPNVFSALQAAANDAVALSAMIGQVGQPGPVSSSTSNVGGSSGVTDRQLRRKAESVCRSLTELCLALGENATQVKPQEPPSPAPQKQLQGSPTITRLSGAVVQRRPSGAGILPDRSPLPLSPRVNMSKLEEKRSTMLNSSTLPSPTIRFTSSIPSTPIDTPGRRTSLLIPRTRRAVTEEPEQLAAGAGRKSSMLRTRRSGTEEPEDSSTGRQSSLVHLRSRRTAALDDDDAEQQPPPSASRFRSSSRSIPESPIRPPVTREFNPQIPVASIESTMLGASALPRRRLAATPPVSSRMVQPASSSGLVTRRYIERTSTDRDANNTAEKPAEDRHTRSLSFNPGSFLNRAGSLTKRAKLTTSR